MAQLACQDNTLRNATHHFSAPQSNYVAIDRHRTIIEFDPTSIAKKQQSGTISIIDTSQQIVHYQHEKWGNTRGWRQNAIRRIQTSMYYFDMRSNTTNSTNIYLRSDLADVLRLGLAQRDAVDQVYPVLLVPDKDRVRT